MEAIAANNPTLTSWVPVPDGSDFPIQNLPYGVFRRRGTDEPARVGVAIGEHVLDLAVLERAGELGPLPEGTFAQPRLNAFLELGCAVWTATRNRVSALLQTGHPLEGSWRQVLVTQAEVEMLMPFAVADYADFYSSEHHATNLGRMFRPDGEALLPNWKRLPVGYHGKAGTVVVSGTPVHRPRGLVVVDGEPQYLPCRQLDVEVEMGTVLGGSLPQGSAALSADAAADHVFGFVLLNDWSGRDIQSFEYQPLGPFLAKSFATTISPWVVTLDALTPFLVPGPPHDPEPAPHLKASEPRGLDIHLELSLDGATVSRPPFAGMYWSWAQQVAHYTSNGGGIRPGDLLGSGTVSGPDPGTEGSLIELTWRGTRPLVVGGEARTFLRDGDTVAITGWAGGGSRPRVGFGACTGTITAPAEV
ncbi:MAG TPA: fumarylacetoacetase [Acidimicrobiales bacterium]